jgi:crotonobetainyl-CoA:carnitine CoA-transferase CaiB-like acyl-CoA transferase
MPEASPPLEGIRVIDLATIYAGPLSAGLLGDFGADVIKVEHPRGDPMRGHGPSKEGHGLWWKVISRNKRTITLDLSTAEGQRILRELVAEADVLVENFRPGVMERWGLGYEELAALNPRLVMLRTTGFGQSGPYRERAGFGTLAESMSGFAFLTGQPDGPPTLPPFGLADGIAGIAGAFALVTALYHRDARGGRGQMIDLAIIEPIFSVVGAQPTIYDQLGLVPTRTGNRSPNNAPRNIYATSDDRWVAISTSAGSIAARVLRLVGRPELIEEKWFATGAGRAEHADLLDGIVGSWIRDRTCDEVIAAFDEAGAAAIPVYDIAQIMDDPQYRSLESVITVEDEDLGPIKMQNVLFRMSETPGAVRYPGRRLGQDNDAVYAELGIDERRRRELGDQGVI